MGVKKGKLMKKTSSQSSVPLPKKMDFKRGSSNEKLDHKKVIQN